MPAKYFCSKNGCIYEWKCVFIYCGVIDGNLMFQGPVRFYDNERKAYILLKQFQSEYIMQPFFVLDERAN